MLPAEGAVCLPVPQSLQGRDVNTGLLVGACLGLPDLVQDLLQRGASPNAHDRQGR